MDKIEVIQDYKEQKKSHGPLNMTENGQGSKIAAKLAQLRRTTKQQL